jgi:hypothetical protein
MQPELSTTPCGRRIGLLAPTEWLIAGSVPRRPTLQEGQLSRSFQDGTGATSIFGVVRQNPAGTNFQPKLTLPTQGTATLSVDDPQFVRPRVHVSILANHIFSHSPCYHSRGPPRRRSLAHWHLGPRGHRFITRFYQLAWSSARQRDLGGVSAPHR